MKTYLSLIRDSLTAPPVVGRVGIEGRMGCFLGFQRRLLCRWDGEGGSPVSVFTMR